MTPTDFLLAAFHEAGHAAVARHFGLRLVSVWIDPASGAGSVTTLGRPSPFIDAMVLLAGSRAERHLFPAVAEGRMSAAKDEARLLTLLGEHLETKLSGRPYEYVDNVADRVDERLARCCEQIVAVRWSAISRLATELARRCEVTGREAGMILGI